MAFKTPDPIVDAAQKPQSKWKTFDDFWYNNKYRKGSWMGYLDDAVALNDHELLANRIDELQKGDERFTLDYTDKDPYTGNKVAKYLFEKHNIPFTKNPRLLDYLQSDVRGRIVKDLHKNPNLQREIIAKNYPYADDQLISDAFDDYYDEIEWD